MILTSLGALLGNCYAKVTLRYQLGSVTSGTTSSTPITVPGLTNVQSLTGGSGADHTCAILTDGSLKCWGYNNGGQSGIALFAISNF